MSPASVPSRHDSDPRVEFFDSLAEQWDRTGPDIATTMRRLGEHADLLRLEPGQRLLEVGCGTGQITGWLADQVAPGKVIALDFAPAMLAQARQKSGSLTVEFRCADVCRDDLSAASYDVVLCFHSFPHFRDQSAALRNLARALRPNGRLLVLHLAGSTQLNAFHAQVGGAVGHDRLPSRSDWQQMLADAGLRICELIDREDLFFLAAAHDQST